MKGTMLQMATVLVMAPAKLIASDARYVLTCPARLMRRRAPVAKDLRLIARVEPLMLSWIVIGVPLGVERVHPSRPMILLRGGQLVKGAMGQGCQENVRRRRGGVARLFRLGSRHP